ncbi:MAG TPA: hypothetical protein VMW73_11515 [Spirochaetia bacterium]|nr:hypothetical protein [Spirochaetia bacterium]
MSRKFAAATIVFLFIGSMAFAVSFTDLGYTVQRQYTDSGVTYSDLTDSQGRAVTVGLSAAELTQSQGDLLNQMVNDFYTLQYMRIDSLKIVFSDSRVEAVVIPSSFRYDGMDIAAYMPSGMQFFYTKALSYDFRLRVDNYFLRFSGQFTDERSFAERLVQTIRNPVEIIRSQDPQYMLQRIDTLEKALGEAVGELRQNESRTNALAKEVDALKSSGASIQSQYDKLLADSSALDARYSELKSSNDTLVNELEKLRYGVMVLHNRGWLFGTIFLPDQKAVKRAVELKTQNPSLTKDQLAKTLQGEGYKISGNELFLVLGLYFDDFK